MNNISQNKRSALFPWSCYIVTPLDGVIHSLQIEAELLQNQTNPTFFKNLSTAVYYLQQTDRYIKTQISFILQLTKQQGRNYKQNTI